MPVIVYVSPDGIARSLGRRLDRQAADILAMAPQTNIGSSTPIAVGGDEHPDRPAAQGRQRRRRIAARAREGPRPERGLGRRAVRQASNLGATEALEKNVIDDDGPDAAGAAEQDRRAKTVPKGIVLHTEDAEITNVDMSLWQQVLDTLIDPNLIVLFMSIGTLGIIVELWNPGLIFPGTVGAI